jgi:hypothetical protein
MSCLLFPIPSLIWALLPTRAARLSSKRHRSQSTILTAIPSSAVGGTLVDPDFGSSPSLRPLHDQRIHQPWLLQLGDYLQPWPQACRTLAKAYGLLAPPRRTSIELLRGVTQSMAMAAHASSTAYNPCTLDLPSISTLVSFYHVYLGFPVKQTWLDAIKAGNCDTFDGLIYSNVARYCPNSDEPILGHLAHQCQNVRSTKAKRSTPLSPTNCPPLPLVPRICHPIKSSFKCLPSAGYTQMTQAAFLLEHTRETSTS